jgi:hypothetical protein
MTSISVTIEGLAPLLHHRYPGEVPETKSKRRTGTKDWKAQAESAKYATEDGELYQPSVHIEQAMVRAASNFQIPSRGKKTYRDLIQAACVVEPDYIIHKHQDYEIDERPVRVQRARVMRYRPKLNKWALDFTITVLDEQLPVEVVREILDHAGRFVGIGDYRPKFGRFQVTKWEAV